MPATSPGKISRAKALRLLKSAREIQGTPRTPSGPPDPALAIFIRGVRAFPRTAGRKSVLDVEIRFDLAPLPALSADDRNDFNDVLVHDGYRRLTSLGIEVFGCWENLQRLAVYRTLSRDRAKVEKMIDAWKRRHVKPGA